MPSLEVKLVVIGLEILYLYVLSFFAYASISKALTRTSSNVKKKALSILRRQNIAYVILMF